MNYAALWHEATQRYCYCLEPGRFLFRLQTAKDDLKSVTLHTLDKYLPLKIRDTRKTTPMKWVASDGLRDYYEVELEFRVVCLRYYWCTDGQRLHRHLPDAAVVRPDRKSHFGIVVPNLYAGDPGTDGCNA